MMANDSRSFVVRWLIHAVCIGWLLCSSSTLRGQDDGERGPPSRSGPSRDQGQREFGPRDFGQRGMSPQSRTALMEYVRKHNPPAARLLIQLERTSPGQFRQALQSLEREVDSLRQFETRDPERFELALKQWRNRTNIDIVLAQIARGQESPSTRQQLQRLLDEQRQVRRELMALELIALEKRTQRLRDQLASMEELSEAEQLRLVDDMLRRAKQSAQRRQRGPQNAESKPPVERPGRNDQ